MTRRVRIDMVVRGETCCSKFYDLLVSLDKIVDHHVEV